MSKVVYRCKPDFNRFDVAILEHRLKRFRLFGGGYKTHSEQNVNTNPEDHVCDRVRFFHFDAVFAAICELPANKPERPEQGTLYAGH